LITVKKALDALKEHGIISNWEMKTNRQDTLKWKDPVVTGTGLYVSNETYGNKSMLYFRASTEEIAKQVAKVLKEAGGKPYFDWVPEEPKYFEMQVHHFKGWHWWE